MVTRKWFIVVAKEEIGPLGPGGLRKLVRRGEILPGSMLRREDVTIAVRADSVRGLFDPERDAQQEVDDVPGPFTSLRAVGWFNFAVMVGWVVVGAIGVVVAIGQRGYRPPSPDDPLPAPGMPVEAPAPPFDALFGIGAPLALVLFLVTGIAFSYWLWHARLNVPHLIRARIRFAPSWTIACWFVPFLNLIRPYQVIEEVDRLSAEAAADGDAAVKAKSGLLVPWWVCTLFAVLFGTAYWFWPRESVAEYQMSTTLHLGASLAIALAALCGALVFLRITLLQERAHAAHPKPVKLRHRFGRREEPQDAATA